MSETLKKKEKSLTLRVSEETRKKFDDFLAFKSKEVGTRLTQAQAFEIIVREMKF